MPRTKKTAAKIKKTEKKEFAEITDSFEVPNASRKKILTLKNIILLVILLSAVFLWKFKGAFIAATVNGQPISKWQLNAQLEKRFGNQVLESIINERLILSAARQKGIFVTGADISEKIKTIEEQLKGQMSLDDALKAQGLTMDDFKKQIEIQVSIDKMFEKESTVSSGEVDEYISKNSAMFKDSTDTAKLKKDVEEMLKQQKTSESFNTWFADLKKNAKVNKFL